MIKPLFDDNGQIIIPTIVLCNRNKHKLGSIYPIKDFEITPDLYGNNEMTFKVYKYNNGVELSIWDKIIDLKLIYIPEYDEYFEIDVDDSETKENVKSVTAINLGVAELSQTNLYDIEINTEEDIARQDYQIAQFYDTLNPNTTILGRVMSKAPHYKINHVDMSLHNIVRQFSINDKDIYGFLTGDLSDEIHCLVKANSNRTIDVYDLYDYCLDCHERADEMNGECPVCHSKNIKNGYGHNTTTYISTENLASEISVETDKDSVKNTFRVQGGDDVINAAIRACNPNGTQYINRFSKETLDDMSNELKNGIVQYQEVYDSKVDEYKQCMNTLYDVLDKILYLESEMMPNPSTDVHTAQSELELLTHDNLSPISVQSLSSAGITTVDNAIKGMFPIYLHRGFSAEIIESKYETGSTTWEGRFRVTNKSIADDNDSNKYAETPMGVFIQIDINEDFENFIKQKLKRILEKESIVELQDIESDDDFKKELELYCKNILSSFSDAYQSCLEVLSGVNASEKNNEFYESLYMQYYRRKKYIDEEILVRERQIIEQENLRDQQISIRDSIQSELNLETFLENIKDGLYNEFCSYRREDTYQNDNYISDGLSNSELIQKAQELLDVAKKEIYKSSETQYAVTTTIGNLFANKDFSVLHDIFVPGNWVRINTDGKIFKLRLLNYTIRESSISELPCEFSNVTKISNGMTDIESILSSAKSMASSFESVKNQAKNASNINVPTKVSELNNDNNYLTIDSSVISNLQIGKLDVVELHAEVAKFGYLTADSAVIANLETNKLNTSDLNAENAKLGYLNATSAIITSLQTDKLNAKDLNAEVAKLGYLTADSATITGKLNANELDAKVAELGYLTANNAVITGKLDANQLSAEVAKLGYAKVDFSNVGSQVVDSSMIKDGAVTNEKVANLSANKITSGTIDASKINVTNLNADNLTVGTINGQRIGNGSLSLDKLSEEVPTKEYLDSVEASLQNQIDGAIETFTKSEIPTLTNEPANAWTDNETRKKHIGDICYVVNPTSSADGYCYRFADLGTNGKPNYSWVLIKDSDVTKALQDIIDINGEITGIKQFDTEISSWKTNTDAELSSLKSRTTTLETDLGTKVETSVFNELKQTVDENSSSITSLSTTVSKKADSSTVTDLTNTVNSVKQTADKNTSSISSMQTTISGKADSSTVTALSTRTSSLEQDLSGFKTTVSNTYATNTDLNKVNTIATQTADKFNWLVKSGTSATDFTLTDRVATLVANDINLNGRVTFSGLSSDAQNKITTAENTANTASSNASTALSTANTANSNASSAISTANSASSKAQGIIDNIYTPNTTTINGGKITTGSIKASQIDVNDLFAQNITASGTINGVTITSKKSGLTDGITITGGELISNEAETYITKLSSGSLYLQGVNGNTNIMSFILNQTDGTNTSSLAPGILTLNGIGYTSHLTPHDFYIVDSDGSRSSITSTTIYENRTALSNKYLGI